MLIRIKVILFFFLCFFCFKCFSKSDDSESYEIYSNQIVSSLAKELKKEFGLICVGEGGCMPYDVQKISIELIAYQKATIEQARELTVKVTEKLIQAINANEEIKPFLR